MGVQVPCRVHAEVPQEGAVWADQAAPGHCITRACPAQGMQDRRRAPDARPCAYADIDPSKILGGRGDRISEREKLDLDCAECGTQAAQLPGPQILGEGLLCFDRRAGRGDDPRLHQKSGNSRQAVGPAPAEAGLLIKSHPRPRILHNRLWRFPYKPPALLGVIGSNWWKNFVAGHRLWTLAYASATSDR